MTYFDFISLFTEYIRCLQVTLKEHNRVCGVRVRASETSDVNADPPIMYFILLLLFT